MPTIPPIHGTAETLDLSYGSSMEEDYSVDRTDFGENYSQRAAVDLNSVKQVWQLSWNGISDDDAETLRLFFRGLRGVTALDWAPYGQDQSAPLKWTATGWTAKPSGYLVQDCSITLSQEFDL